MEDLSDDDVFQPSKSSLHKKLNSNDISLSCKFCQAKFTLRQNLFRHERRCGQPKKESNSKDISLNCKFCQAKFTLRHNLFRHERRCGQPKKESNPKDISLNCKLCEAKFTLRKNLLVHERRCGQPKKESNPKDISLNCKLCEAKFTLRQNLFRHERRCGQPEKKSNSKDISLNCKLCQAKFTLRKNLLVHERRAKCGEPKKNSNSKDISLSCKLCQATYNRRSNLLRHERKCIRGDVGRFKCRHCNKQFKSKPLLRSHIEEFHPEIDCTVDFNCMFCNAKFKRKQSCKDHESKCNANPQPNPHVFLCAHCGAQFNRRDTLKKHLNKCSSENPLKARNKILCLIQNCSCSFRCKVDLIQHLSVSHHDEITLLPKVSMNFTSIDEFKVWKEEEEEKTFSYFTRKSGKTSNSICHYYCQHDGSGKRHKKNSELDPGTTRRNRRGRIKLGHTCIAKMKVTTNDNEAVQLEYYPTHNHECKVTDVLHHPIPSEMSKYINEKLDENLPPSVVYELAKKRFIEGNEQANRTPAGTLSKKMVSERARKRRKALRSHEDDAESVYLMAAKLIETDNSVLIYKPLGQGVLLGPEKINDLPNSDELFMFAIQTDEQLDVMKKYCWKIIIVDKTHGTNQYNYQLLTAMVIDDDGCGWAVAHLITSDSDACSLKFFFQVLRSRLDQDHPISCVMTDDDSALIDAMEAGFSQSLIHLLCKWRVVKKLKENLRSKVPNHLFETIFNELKAILNAENEPLFLQLKESFVRKYEMDTKTSKCMSFLVEDFWSQANKWATCYRNFHYGGVNTTVHVKSFHNRLKKYYLKRKVSKRLDDLINILYGFAREDHCSRCRNASAKSHIDSTEIVERHKRGISMNNEVILEETLDGLWEVKFQHSKKLYFIEQYKDSCDIDDCPSKCLELECHGLCSHLFSCSCADLHLLCEHIHRLQAFLFKDVVIIQFDDDDINSLRVHEEEVYDIVDECVTHSAYDEKKQIALEKLQGHVSFLQQFFARDIQEIPDNCIFQGEALLSKCVKTLQMVENLCPTGN